MLHRKATLILEFFCAFPFRSERRDLYMKEEKKVAGIYIRVSTEDKQEKVLVWQSKKKRKFITTL